MRRDVVVVGASSGGIDALRAIAAALPADFPGAIAVVLHMAADSPGILHTILARAGPLDAVRVQAEEPLRPATFFVARPDHHLLMEPGIVRSTRGPPEKRFRPAVDPLFRSAARAYGPRVIGVILTGGLDDGTAGLRVVKQLGGVAVVQDPRDALAPSMPESALTAVRIDHRAKLADIPALLVRLVTEDLAAEGGYRAPGATDVDGDIARAEPPVNRRIDAALSRSWHLP